MSDRLPKSIPMPILIASNIVILVIAFVALEASFRVVKTVKACLLHNYCNPSKLFEPATVDPLVYFAALTKQDSRLGYTLSENWNGVINFQPLWKQVKVTTDYNGCRISSQSKMNSYKKKILTVGDSFTFGDQVSNSETWQSYANLNSTKYQFINCGVGGYGTAQSMLRAFTLYDRIKPDILIQSVLVGWDMKRDQLVLHWGFPVPSVIKTGVNGRIKQSPPIDCLANAGCKYSSLKPPYIVKALSFSYLYCKLFPQACDLVGRRTTYLSPNAATVPEILNYIIQQYQRSGTHVVWLLHYNDKISEDTQKERRLIRNTLAKKRIFYIDTYDLFHSPRAPYKVGETYYNHHTRLGNSLLGSFVDQQLNKAIQ